jgi:hypothetical protein
MKKRINLTDGELAIAMWLYVKEKIKSADITGAEKYESVTEMKQHFLKEHSKGEHYWYNVCLLCQRYVSERGTCDCPLSEGGLDCGSGSTWLQVANFATSEAHRQKALKACDKIIRIMEREAEVVA